MPRPDEVTEGPRGPRRLMLDGVEGVSVAGSGWRPCTFKVGELIGDNDLCFTFIPSPLYLPPPSLSFSSFFVIIIERAITDRNGIYRALRNTRFDMDLQDDYIQKKRNVKTLIQLAKIYYFRNELTKFKMDSAKTLKVIKTRVKEKKITEILIYIPESARML